jgi:GT2 family glycosyltransferase
MHHPNLSDLTPPPPGRTGWPWTEEGSPLPDVMPNGESLPRISIVTPSYNQAQFLEETIRSVLLQNYPNLEYIIIDGGSTDESVEIIRKYESHLAYWVSERDRGQSDAISKGFRRATGEMLAWINSDDVYKPNAVAEAVKYLMGHAECPVVYGDVDFVDGAGKFISHFQTDLFLPPRMFFDHFIPQPAAFIRRQAFELAGGLDTALHFCMDYDLWLRVALNGCFEHVPRTWALYRVHGTSKSTNLQALRWTETAQSLSRFFARSDIPTDWLRYRSSAIGHAHWCAAVELYRSGQRDEALGQVLRAVELDSTFLASRELAGRLVGSIASEVDQSILETISDFFALVPAEVSCKSRGFRQAVARAEALIAINEATETRLAGKYARRALWRDKVWLRNRHVISRALH